MDGKQVRQRGLGKSASKAPPLGRIAEGVAAPRTTRTRTASATTKVSVTIPADVEQRARQVAADLNVSFSRFVSEAVDRANQASEDAILTAQINQAIAFAGADDEDTAAVIHAGRSALANAE